MKNSDIEAKLQNAVAHSVPDVLDGILAACEEQKGTVIVMEQVKKRKVWRSSLAAAAALVIVLGGAFGFGQYQKNHTVDSIISFDVNPSVELLVNAKERVLEAIPLNDDAVGILDGMDLHDTDLDVAVNALIGSMMKNGYIDELKNSILVSVENADAAKGTALQQRIVQEIDDLLQSSSIEGAILSQTVNEGDAALQSLADQYGITISKAALIQSVVAQNQTLAFADLAGLSIHEINLIASSKETKIENLTSTGHASDKAYIGEEAAKQIAFDHAGVAADAVSQLKVEFDSEDGVMTYEIDFYSGNMEYEYDINAKTGEIVKFEREDEDYMPSTSTPSGTTTGNGGSGTTSSGGNGGNYIGEEQAKQIALNHAGMAEADAGGLWVKFDYDDGRAVYEVDFHVNGIEYEYEIDATSGDVRSWDWDEDDDYRGQTGSSGSTTGQTSGSDTNNSGNYVGEARAKEIALNHAGVDEAEASRIQVSFDYDDGLAVYEVEFHVGQVEYDYEIDASTGNIRSWDQDMDD